VSGSQGAQVTTVRIDTGWPEGWRVTSYNCPCKGEHTPECEERAASIGEALHDFLHGREATPAEEMAAGDRAAGWETP
jgi:hypothetical protein